MPRQPIKLAVEIKQQTWLMPTVVLKHFRYLPWKKSLIFLTMLVMGKRKEQTLIRFIELSKAV